MKIFKIICLILVNHQAVHALDFQKCQKVILANKSLDDFLVTDEKGERKKEEQLNKDIEKLKANKDCLALIRYSELADNGLLKKRNPLASHILKTFVQYHSKWLLPEDLDQQPRCQDTFHRDIYDYESPAYHLTRALFQPSRKASMAVTSYADLRALTKGENPNQSEENSLSLEEVTEHFQFNEEYQFKGQGDLIGFLYQKRYSIKGSTIPQVGLDPQDWKNEFAKGSFNIFSHLGGGLIGNPYFIIANAPKEAFEKGLSQSDGRNNLPRRLAKSIIENLLCQPLLSHNLKTLTHQSTWYHPLTQEQKCVNCHSVVDPLSAGLRNVTFVKSHSRCSKKSPQVLIPRVFKGTGQQEIWQEKNESPFHRSYPVGHLNGKRFVGFNQLGKLISEQTDFYSCQIKKYSALFGLKELEPEKVTALAKQYQSHQNGLLMLEKLLKESAQ
ncbi:MAG: hypothetical protein VXV96_11835 [Bdellovibrionota bacterium]|nr:hypothetical protein [Bdellovibrionota bacterium]